MVNGGTKKQRRSKLRFIVGSRLGGKMSTHARCDYSTDSSFHLFLLNPAAVFTARLGLGVRMLNFKRSSSQDSTCLNWRLCRALIRCLQYVYGGCAPFRQIRTYSTDDVLWRNTVKIQLLYCCALLPVLCISLSLFISPCALL